MTHYDDVIIPQTMRFGSSSTPLVAVDQIFFDSGFRTVNRRWSQYLRTLTLEYKNAATVFEEINRVWMAVGGPYNSFLCRDWSDWNTTQGNMAFANPNVSKTDQPMINTVTGSVLGDGVTKAFQLIKQYAKGSASHNRYITKPDSSSVLASVDNVLQRGPSISPNDYSLDATTGIVTFDYPPANNSVPKWGGYFYVPVAFVNESFPITLEDFNVHGAGQIELREIRL